MKPGWRTSEFWITLVCMCGGLGLAHFGESLITQLVGGVLVTLNPIAYKMGRSLVKSNEAKGAALVEASRSSKK